MSSTKQRTAVKAKSRKEADVISNKIMAAFAVSLIGMFGLMILRTRVAAQGPATMTGLKVLAVLGLVILGAGIFLTRRAKNAGQKGYYWYAFIAIAGVATTVCSVLMLLYGAKVCSFLAFILPVIAIYYFLSTVFSTENFIILLLSGLGAVLFWYTYRLNLNTPFLIVLYVLYFVLLAACAAGAIGGKKSLRKIFDSKKHLWLYITVALLAVLAVLALILGGAPAYIFMYVALVYTLAQIVIMTTKL